MSTISVDWTRKILAHLHDPPEKPFDFGAWHRERAEHYSRRLGLSLDLWKDKSPDWTAAGADRFIFPDPSRVKGLGQGIAFRHPLSGDSLPLEFPDDQDEIAGLLDNSFPEYAGDLTEAERFFLLWRCWLPAASSQAGGTALPYLPADTRIPDGSIWNHNSVVSALEGTRDSSGRLAPALLLFQIGPVQDFISQARSTRDLWSGSFLISWLVASGLKFLSDQVGPDCVVFPSLRGQALFDWLNKDILERAKHRQGDSVSDSFWKTLGLHRRQDDVLVPNLPNRFLAIVPEDFDPSAVEASIRKEWSRISDDCLEFLQSECPLPGAALDAWAFQTSQFLQVTWTKSPWMAKEDTLAESKKTGSGVHALLAAMHAAAESIPEKDSRCYPLNSGVFWSGHFDIAAHRLDARRSCHDFGAWVSTLPIRERDALSGKEEALIDSRWLAEARKRPALRFLFRNGDKLGAVNLVKRLWHLASLDRRHGLRRARTSFDSVYAVAAGSWKANLGEMLLDAADGPAMAHIFTDFARSAPDAARALSDGASLAPPRYSEGEWQIDRWLDTIDGSYLDPATWDDLDADATIEEKRLASDAKRTLLELQRYRRKDGGRVGAPSAYYAVIALDGDRVGEWLSGVHNPKVKELLSTKASSYFGSFGEGRTWLDSPRPLSPSFHLGFSEALSNFGLYAAVRIVQAHHGQLIYSGGDDVLAMVPAEEAIGCVRGLRMAFQGDPRLADDRRYRKYFRTPPGGGLVHLVIRDDDGSPTWPLIVPGPRMTVSAGVAIGHAKAPLQDMVEEARAAEKKAKTDRSAGGFGRDAVAVSLIKRSGEILHWGARFGGAGIEVLELFQTLSRSGAIPGTFGHRVPELLNRLDPTGTQAIDPELTPVLLAEIRWAWDQIEGGDRGKRSDLEERFFGRLEEYLAELARTGAGVSELSCLFSVETFLKRHSA